MSDLGDLLRRARAHKGVTLRDAEKRTRISRTYLAALEAHDFDQLPPRAYARGIVRTYAQYLGLDPAAVLSMFEAAGSEADHESDDVQVVPAVQPIEIHGHWAPNFAIIIFMLVISAVIFTWIYSAYLQPEDDEVPTTISQPTATSVDQSLLDVISLTPTPSEVDGTDGDGDTNSDENVDENESTPSESEAAPTATPSDEQDQEGAIATASEAPDSDVDPESGEGDQDDGSVDPPPGPEVLPPDVVIPAGYNVFAVYAEAEVWVFVTLDGASVAMDAVLQAGQTEIFVAQTATVTSGNAANVRVYVNGEDYGTLGEPWDAERTYP